MWATWAFCKVVHISMPTPYLSIKQPARTVGVLAVCMGAGLALRALAPLSAAERSPMSP